MFVAFSHRSVSPAASPGTERRIADCVGPGATWHRGRRVAVCTADPARVDVAVNGGTDGDPLAAVFGDAYLDDAPLTARAFAVLDGAYDRINGEFAAVVETDSGVRVVSDRLNLRGLFVYRGPTQFVASTSVRAVLAYLDDAGCLAEIALDRTALTEFLDFGHLLGSKTHFSGIDLLPAATTLDVDGGGDELRYEAAVYWAYRYGPYVESEAEAVRELADALRAAMTLRTDPDLRLGLHLSGGMDSRLLLAATPSAANLTAYTFGTPYNDEAAVAGLAARVAGRPRVHFPLSNYLVDQGPHGVAITDGHSSMRHFHHLPSMASLVGRCDRLFVGTCGDGFLGGSKLTPGMLDGSFDTEDLHHKTSHFDAGLWGDVFGPAGYFDVRTARRSLADSFDGIDADEVANRMDTWNLLNRQARFIFQAGPRSINYYVPVSNPLADTRVVEAWCRIPPRMRIEGDLRVGVLRALNRTLALVPLAGTWAPPVAPPLRYVTGAARVALGHRALRSRLPGVSSADPFGYPDYGEWIRSDPETTAFVARALSSFAARGWADGDGLAAALAAHRRGDAGYTEELCILVSLELWLQRVFADHPELAGDRASGVDSAGVATGATGATPVDGASTDPVGPAADASST